MKGVIRSQIGILGLVFAWAGPATAAPITLIGDLRYEPERHAVVFRISGPVAISSRELGQPRRYVIDIPDAHWRHANGVWRYNDPYFKAVRVSQFGIFPPVVRIVLEGTTRRDVTLAIQQDPKHLYITVASLQDQPDEHPHHMKPPPSSQPDPAIRPSFAPVVPSSVNTDGQDRSRKRTDSETAPEEAWPEEPPLPTYTSMRGGF